MCGVSYTGAVEAAASYAVAAAALALGSVTETTAAGAIRDTPVQAQACMFWFSLFI
jgi:hypothetical protein